MIIKTFVKIFLDMQSCQQGLTATLALWQHAASSTCYYSIAVNT